MVSRKLNRPAYKIRNNPIFWLHEVVQSEWPCRSCNELQKPGVCFEVMYRMARKGAKGEKGDAVKLFLCMTCAEKMLETVLDKVKIVKAHGKEGLSLFDEV